MTRRGFTLKELLICVVVVALLAALALIFLDKARKAARQNYDSMHVRGIHQGLVMSAQSGQDTYFLPSLFDKADQTLAGEPKSKDTTANIISLLIYCGLFGPELCVSTAETNPSIRMNTTYQYSNPSSAVNPRQALWDPSFSADFTDGKIGNFSYAHLLPFGERRKRWTNTFSATEPIVANRGPRVDGLQYGDRPLDPTIAFDRKSYTLGIHGPRRTWEGHVVYNDNHVEFETRLDPQAAVFKRENTTFADCLSFDEPEDPDGMNALLGIFTTAGATAADWHSIWD